MVVLPWQDLLFRSTVVRVSPVSVQRESCKNENHFPVSTSGQAKPWKATASALAARAGEQYWHC